MRTNTRRFAANTAEQPGAWRNYPLLALVTVLTVVAAGCAVSSDVALPLLPPAPIRSTGTFTVDNQFAACPAGSTAANPGTGNCKILAGAVDVDVLADAFLGSTYSVTIQTRGGLAPVTSCSFTGTPPPGLTISVSLTNNTQCVITGTVPTSLPVTIPPGGFVVIAFTIRATDSSNPAASDTQDAVIRIFAGFSFTTTVLENGTQTQTYNKLVVTNVGGGRGVAPLVNCTATGLPTGLTVVVAAPTDCRIQGTPTVNGTFTVTVTATDSAVPANVRSSPAYTLVINPQLVVTAPNFTGANGTINRAFASFSVATTGGQRPLTACTATGLPAGMNIVPNPANTATNANTCLISGTPTASGTFNVVVTATDTIVTDPAQGGATVTPASVRSSTPAAALVINPALAVTTLANAFLDAIVGRTYAFTTASGGGVTATGGQLGYTWSILTPVGCAGLTLIDNADIGDFAGTPTVAGSCTFTAQVADTATTSTAAGTATANFVLTIRSEFLVTQASLADAVEGRTYGQAALIQPVTTNVLAVAGGSDFGQAAENGNGPLTNCAVVTVTGGTLTTADFSAVVDTTANQCRLQSTAALPAGSAGTYSVTVSATDTGIAAGGVAVPAGPVSRTLTLVVRAPLAATLTQFDGSTTQTNPANLLNASIGRSYGTGAQATAAPTYAATGGLAAPGPFTWTITAGAAQLTTASFALSSATGTPVTLASAGVTGAPQAAFTITLQVADAGNTAVPPGNASISTQLTINGAPAITLAQAGNATPNTALFNAVAGRSYATGAQSGAAPTWTASGGVGSGQWCLTAGVAELTAGSFTGISFVCATPTAGASVTLTSANVTGPSPVGPFAVTVQLTDSGNAAVPAGGAVTDSTNLTIQAALAANFSQFDGTVTQNNPPVLLDGVDARPYGVGAQAAAAPTFTATGGSGTYSWCISAGTLPGGFTGISSACGAPTVGNPLTLTANPVTVPGGGSFLGIVAQVTDGAGNPAVPSGVATTIPFSITIRAVLSATFSQFDGTVVQNNPATLLNAVDGRGYAQGAQLPAAPTYTAAGGIGTYGWCISAGALPGGFTGISTNCGARTVGNPVLLGAATVTVAGGGAFPGIVAQVADAGNAAVPVGLAVTGATSITVNPALVATLRQFDGTLTQLNPANLLVAVQNRSYGVITAGAGAPVYDANTAITPTPTGIGPYSWCQSGGILPASFGGVAPCPVATAGNTITISSAAAGAPGNFPGLVVQVTDTGNAAVAAANALSTPTTLTINPPLASSLTQTGNATPNTALFDAADQRSYAQGAQAGAAPTYTATAGTGTGAGFRWCVSSTVNMNTLGFASISAACGAPTVTNPVTLDAANVNLAAVALVAPTTLAVTVQLDDPGNVAVPASLAAGESAVNNTSITIQAALTATLTQFDGTTTQTNPAALLNGVDARSYAQGAQSGAAPTYTGTGGIGTYAWCIFAGTLPNGMVGISNACGAPTVANPATLNSPNISVVGGGAFPGIIARLTDTGNAAVPAGLVNASTTSITINRALAATLTQFDGTVTQTNPATLLVAVQNRSYGQISAGAAAAVYSAILPSATGIGPYSWCLTGPATLLTAGFSGVADCPVGTPGNTVSLTAATAGFPSVFNPIVLQVTDAGNAAVPSGAALSSGTSLTINPPLGSSLSQTGNATPNTALLDAVDQRSYAQGAQAGAAPTYSATAGSGVGAGFRWCISATNNNPPNNAINMNTLGFASISSVCGTPTVANPVTLDAANVNLAAVGLTSPASLAVTVQLDDPGNAAVPGSLSVAESAVNNTNLAVQPAMVVDLTQFDGTTTQTNPANLLIGVDARSYGTISGGAAAPTYTATNALGAVSMCISAGALPSGLTGISTNCGAPTAGNPLTLSSASLAVAAGGNFSFTVQATDPGSLVVPGGNATRVVNIRVNAALAARLSQPGNAPTVNPANLLDGVTGRSYGNIGGTPAFDAFDTPGTNNTGAGVGTYRWCTAAVLPFALTASGGVTDCGTGVTAADVFTISTGSATPAGGPTTITGQLTDVGNAAVPAGGPVNAAADLTIRSALSITTAQASIINGLKDSPYPGITFAGTGGLTATNVEEWRVAAGGNCPAQSGTFPAGLTLGLTTGSLAGTPTTASTATNQFTFDVCLDDTGNAATPGTPAVASFVLNVMSRFVYVTDTANDTVQVITSETVPTHTGTNISTGAGSNPEQIAISPNSRKVFVTLPGTNEVAVIDTITNAVTATIDVNPGGECTGPNGIAAGRVPAVGDRVYVTCTGGTADIVEIDAATNAVLNSVTLSAAGTLDSVAFKTDGTRAYVTDNANNRLYAFDTTVNPPTEVDLNGGAAGNDFALSGGSSAPKGIIVVPNAANFYAYVAKSSAAAQSDVINVTTDTPAIVTTIDHTNNVDPFYYGVSADGLRIFLSRNAGDQFSVYDNNVATPVAIGGSVALTSGGTGPYGLTCPVVGGRVFIAANGTDEVVIHNDTTPFAAAATNTIALQGGAASTPRGIKHIPIPR
jgi:YVTN family beta-propeller protein